MKEDLDEQSREHIKIKQAYVPYLKSGNKNFKRCNLQTSYITKKRVSKLSKTEAQENANKLILSSPIENCINITSCQNSRINDSDSMHNLKQIEGCFSPVNDVKIKTINGLSNKNNWKPNNASLF